MVDGLDGAAFAFITGWYLVPGAVFVWWGFRPLGRRVTDWAAVRDVPLTAETHPFVAARLRRARRWRTIGLTAGWLTPYAAMLITQNPHMTNSVLWFAWLLGYVLGALAAELWSAVRAPRSGAAVLTTRELRQYLPVAPRRWAAAVGTAAVLLVALAVVLPRRDGWAPLALADSIAVTGVVLAAWVGLETLPRLVVRRRQPFQTPDLLRADDALRSWSAHAVTGGLLCLMLGGVGQHVLALAAASDLSALRWVGFPAGIVLVGFSLAVLRHLSDYRWRWRVPRHGLQPSA